MRPLNSADPKPGAVSSVGGRWVVLCVNSLGLNSGKRRFDGGSGAEALVCRRRSLVLAMNYDLYWRGLWSIVCYARLRVNSRLPAVLMSMSLRRSERQQVVQVDLSQGRLERRLASLGLVLAGHGGGDSGRGRGGEAGRVVGFDHRLDGVGGQALRVLLGAAVGHHDGYRIVKVRKVDFVLPVVALGRQERGEALAPPDLPGNVRGLDLEQGSRRLSRAFEDHDNLELVGEKGLGGESPEGTGGCDPVGDGDRPKEEDEGIGDARLGDQVEGVLAERDQLALARLAAANE